MRILEIKGHRAKLPISGSNLPELVSTIVSDCSEYFSMIGSAQRLYRGRVGSQFDFFKSATADGRINKDSNDIISGWVDQLLKQKGIKARRDNSIFCIGTAGRAAEYGTVYEIFPINGFHYTFAVKHEDIILSPFSGVRDKWLKPGPSAVSSMLDLIEDEINDGSKKQLEHILFKIQHRTFTWNDVHGLPYNHPIWEAMLTGKYPILQLDETAFFNHYKIRADDGLSDAINMNSEIWVQGEYYAVRHASDSNYGDDDFDTDTDVDNDTKIHEFSTLLARAL